MMNGDRSPRESWSSGVGFILAAAGSAIGLGNVWKFPYVTGENGGGAFVLVYLACIAIIGIPVLLCEITLGRHTQRNPVGAFKRLAPSRSRLAQIIGMLVVLCGLIMLGFRSWGWGALSLIIGVLIFRYRWVLVGAMGVLAGFVILSYYSVVGGWTIGYIFKAVTGSLAFSSVDIAKDHFAGFTANPWSVVGCHFVFIVLCVSVVYRGVQSGIERWSKILMPLLLTIMVLLILRGLTLENAWEGVRFYLSPDFSKIEPKSILIALGHAFFSLSLGMGAIITYGSYLKRDQNLFSATLSVVGLDTLISLMAGLAIFPAVFAMGFKPDLGPGLVFQVLPTVFNHIPLGALWAALFFILLLIAALSSGISLLEVVTAYCIDERGWSRKRAAVVIGAVIFVLGCGSALSLSHWQRMPAIKMALVGLFGKAPASFFDLMDQLSSNWLLPLGGLFISLFVGWVWGTRKAVEEIRKGSSNFADIHLWSLLAGLKDDPSHNAPVHVVTLASLWGVFIRFVTPVAIMIAFLHAIGWLKI